MEEQIYNSEADIRLITGDQRQGKTTLLVAYAKDDYYANLDGLLTPSGNKIKASALTEGDRQWLRLNKIIPHPFKYVKVFSDDKKESKMISIPKGYLVTSPIKIFSNIHLYGLIYKYTTLEELLEYINSDIITNGWVLSDESAWTDPRNSMTAFGKVVAMGLGATIGKRNVHFCQATQYFEMIERRFRLFWTTRCACTYDEETKMIIVEMKKKGEDVRTDEIYAPYYFPNFDSNERIPIPEKMVARALESLSG